MKPTVVVGGQAGSEGKGMVCGKIIEDSGFDWAVRMGGPNAGHTIYDASGFKYPLRQIPVAAVVDRNCALVISAGSEIDFEVLIDEIHLLESCGHVVRDRLFIDVEATVLTPDHVKAESSIQTGSTKKGIGAARAARALREATRVGDYKPLGFHALDTQALLRERYRAGDNIFLEGTQGYILGSHAGYYPYCTSGDCRASDFLAAVGLPPMETETWVVLRSYPIRIAGDSGPLEEETSWESIGVEPEITTVTKKVRRVGEWDWDWAERSIEANRGIAAPEVALTFVDYWCPGVAGLDGPAKIPSSDLAHRIETIEERLDVRVSLLGTGPDTAIWR